MLDLLAAVTSAATAAPVRHEHIDTIRLISWHAADVLCGSDVVVPVRMETPATLVVRSADPVPMAEAVYHFRIDGSGRPLSITPDSATAGEDRAANDDFEPALAGSQFPAAQSHALCTVHYVPWQSPIRIATVEQLAAVAPDGGLTFDEFREALRRPGDTCTAAPAPRNLSYPALDTLPDVSGHTGGTLARFDVDAAGATGGIEVIYNSGPPEMAAQVLQSLKDSRFAPGAKHGCVAGYRIAPRVPLKPPPAPSNDLFVDRKGRCPGNASKLIHVEDVPFPVPFQHRNIEGWGIVRFDITPDGAIANLSVIRAEPAAGFGDQAMATLLAAHGDPTPNGYFGCVTRIRFELDDAKPVGVSGGKADSPGP